MIITDKPSIKFERIVKENVDDTLNKLGFFFEDEITPEEDSHAGYSRTRKGIYEAIYFVRRNYSDKYDNDFEDEAEKEPYLADENDKCRYSRHFFEVSLVINHGGRNLLTTGEAGIGRNGEEYWYFEDEEDLRTLLREKIIPLLTTVVMKDFDERLEDESEYSAKKNKQTNQETSWQSDSEQTAKKA